MSADLVQDLREAQAALARCRALAERWEAGFPDEHAAAAHLRAAIEGTAP